MSRARRWSHDLALHVTDKSGKEIVLPVTADPKRGGLVLDPKALIDNKLDQEATGYLRGMWGFQPFDGPSFHLASAKPETWHVSSTDESALITGRLDKLHLHSANSACVSNVSVKDEKGGKIEAAWKDTAPGELDVDPNLEKSDPGRVTVDITQFGLPAPDELHLQAYAEAGHLAGFTIYAGDSQGTLRGTRLDEVSGLDLNGIRFTPGALSRTGDQDQLQMSLAPPAVKADLPAQQKLVAKVTLKDGRVVSLPFTVATQRPAVAIISKSIQYPTQPATAAQPAVLSPATAPHTGSALPPVPLEIHLSAPDELPLTAKLSFSIRSVVPEKFPRTQTIDVATDDESLHTTLSVDNGRLVLEDATTVVATLDPARDLGTSAFGPLKFRPVDPSGATGDWQPLAQLVRLPSLTQLRCVKGAPNQPCVLTGTSLFLIEAIAANADFTNSISVPEGYADLTLTVPHPDSTKTLYVKLRDDPTAINTAQAAPAVDASQESATTPPPSGAAAVGNH
jgi:hypothetical protein